MQLKRRHALLVVLLVGQLACLSLGALVASRWLTARFSASVQQAAVAQGRSTVADLARRIADRGIDDVAPGTTGWTRLQKLCERLNPPHDGFVAVVHRGTGGLVYPLRDPDDETRLGEFPGRSAIVSGEAVLPLIEAARRSEVRTGSPAFGEVEVGGRLYQAACLSVPRLDSVLVVYQSQAAIDASVASLVTPLVRSGLGLLAALAFGNVLLIAIVGGRYERKFTALRDSVDREVDRRTISLTRSRNAAVFGLAKLAESRDKDAGQHLERMRTYVTILATELAKHNSAIDHHYVANLAIASALHDIGKMGVPDGVVLKLGRLTPAERRAMQMHTVLGGECLASVERMLGDRDAFLDIGREIALAHHEQWDGSGYPHGLQGKSIPLSARIVALADVYDALTSNRVYRPAVSHEVAREWIVSNYGSQFDPEVVEAFVAREQDFAKISATVINEQRATSGDEAQAPDGVEGTAAPARA